MNEYDPNHGIYASDCLLHQTVGICNGSCNEEFIRATSLYVLDSIASEVGLIRFEKISKKEENGMKITLCETVVGFYTDEFRHYGIIHHSTNRNLLPKKMQKNLKQLQPIDKYYDGENYTLIKYNQEVFAVKSDLINKIKEIINEIDTDEFYQVVNYLISPNGNLFGILMNDGSLFIVATLIASGDYAEEERISITSRIHQAQPFFNFEPYKKVDWRRLKKAKGKHFEALCEVIMSNQDGIEDIQPIGKTNAADRGRDFIIIEDSRDLNGQISKKKWLVQCKYSEDTIHTKSVSDWVNRVVEHDVDGYWILTNNDISPSLFDQLKDVTLTNKIKVETRIWQRNKFDTLFNTNPEWFTEDNFE